MFSLTDVALCTKEERLPSNAEMQQVLKRRRDDCLLLDAIERYHSAVQLTSPSAPKQNSHVIVSTFAVTLFSGLAQLWPVSGKIELGNPA